MCMASFWFKMTKYLNFFLHFNLECLQEEVWIGDPNFFLAKTIHGVGCGRPDEWVSFGFVGKVYTHKLHT